MRLRYAGVCRACATGVPAGTTAVYEKDTRTVLCLTCAATLTHAAPADRLHEVDRTVDGIPAPPPKSPECRPPVYLDGVAGASARREHERRRQAREQRVRERHPKLGGLILALSDDPQSTTAWAAGAHGEERLGRRLDGLAGPEVRVLHDRRIPGTRANIDHLVVTRSGVYVVDAKRYRGRPQRRVEGGLLSPRTEKLLVGRRDCTRLVDGVLKQVELARQAVGDPSVALHGVLCFVEADWPLVGGDFTTRGVQVLWPKKLASRLTAAGPVSETHISTIWQRLGAAFPPA